MSKSDSISATSYWSRQKFKFKADAVHDDMSRLNYEYSRTCFIYLYSVERIFPVSRRGKSLHFLAE